MAASIAWPTVWPRFSTWRRPASRSSSATTASFVRRQPRIVLGVGLAALPHPRPQRPAGDQRRLHDLRVAGSELLAAGASRAPPGRRSPPTAGGTRPRSSCPRAGPPRSSLRTPSPPAPRARSAPGRAGCRAGRSPRRSRRGRPQRRRPRRPRCRPARRRPRRGRAARTRRRGSTCAPRPASRRSARRPRTAARAPRLVGDHEPAPVGRVEEAGRDQPAAEEHRVLARRGGRPDEPGALGRGLERAQRRAARAAARRGRPAAPARRPPTRRAPRGRRAAGRSGRGRGRAAGPCRRPAATPPRAPPRDGRRCGAASASRTRSEPSAPPPSATTARVLAGEQLEHQLLLARAKRVLALPVEEGLDRLAEPPLELAIGVERLRAELGAERAGAGGLAGAHEAHEHEGYARLQPIRSRYAASAARTSSMWSPPNFSR